MIALAAALWFVGYLLIYAAVAGGGKYALAPWKGLTA